MEAIFLEPHFRHMRVWDAGLSGFFGGRIFSNGTVSAFLADAIYRIVLACSTACVPSLTQNEDEKSKAFWFYHLPSIPANSIDAHNANNVHKGYQLTPSPT